MANKRPKPEEIVSKLRQVEVLRVVDLPITGVNWSHSNWLLSASVGVTKC